MTDQQYLRYKEIRNLSWQFLVDFNIDRLPVKVSKIGSKMDITILSFSEGESLIKECSLKFLTTNDAFSVYTDKWYCLYRDDIKKNPFLRYSLMHEIGHISLKHPMKEQKVGYFTAFYTEHNKSDSSVLAIEQEANLFASRILSPAFVLHCIQVWEAEEISALCGLPLWEAEERSKRIKKLAEKENFFTHTLEKKAFEQFQNYIDSYILTNNQTEITKNAPSSLS